MFFHLKVPIYAITFKPIISEFLWLSPEDNTVSQEMLKISITDMSLKIAN